MGSRISITDLKTQHPMPSVFRERYLFSLDVNDFGICVECLTSGDDVRFVFYGGLDNRL